MSCGREKSETVEYGKEYPLLADKRPSYENETWFADTDGLLVVVDRKTALPEDYSPPDLVSLSALGIPTEPAGLKARQVIVPDLLALFAAGRGAGHDFFVFSAYRSYPTQEKTFQYWVQTEGEEQAGRSSARAGHSEHQLGTTLDISAREIRGDVFAEFGAAAAGRWLALNAWKYGFVMSYPQNGEAESGYMYEPWHFRYLGREVAAIIKDKGLVPVVFLKELEGARESKKKSS